jgi:exodeoxyribonuclease VII large subunit
MSIPSPSRKIFSLLDVARSIQKTLSERYGSSFWVKAEMNKLNHYRQSGHCYPELVEKLDGKVVAQMKATLWQDDFVRINADFQRVLKEPLKDGIKVLMLVTIEFHPHHGLSLRIVDIDPSFTLGDLEREKLETIAKLKAEGVFGRNKELTLPILPQRLAIISVETSKGYADFLKVLEGANKSWNYHFFQLLFPSILQGDNAVAGMIYQLDRIRTVRHHFDAVAIIRGGGGDIGLSCYNDYRLARAIALFPIPVLTGIGHATNETVAEMVAFENAITPTKMAEFLIQKFHNFSVPVKDAQRSIADCARRLTADEKVHLLATAKLLKSAARNAIDYNQSEVRMLGQALVRQTVYSIDREKIALASTPAIARKAVVQQLRENQLRLISMEQNVNNLSPQAVLKRGYSITMLNGKPVKSIADVAPGDTLETVVIDGTLRSVASPDNISDFDKP